MKSAQRAFTLIELLVVIAIIGVLSSIILASLNSARGKGADAAIKSDLNTVVAQSVIDYDGFPNAYTTSANSIAVSATPAAWTLTGTGVPGAAQTTILTTSANSAHEGATASQALIQASNSDGGQLQWGIAPTWFVVQAALTTTGYWCIDSSNTAKYETSLLAANATKCS